MGNEEKCSWITRNQVTIEGDSKRKPIDIYNDLMKWTPIYGWHFMEPSFHSIGYFRHWGPETGMYQCLTKKNYFQRLEYQVTFYTKKEFNEESFRQILAHVKTTFNAEKVHAYHPILISGTRGGYF